MEVRCNEGNNVMWERQRENLDFLNLFFLPVFFCDKLQPYVTIQMHLKIKVHEGVSF